MGRRMLLHEAADELGVSGHFLRQEVIAGRVPYITSGNRYIIDVEQCEEVLKNRALENMNKVNDSGNGFGTLRQVKE